MRFPDYVMEDIDEEITYLCPFCTKHYASKSRATECMQDCVTDHHEVLEDVETFPVWQCSGCRKEFRKEKLAEKHVKNCAFERAQQHPAQVKIAVFFQQTKRKSV